MAGADVADGDSGGDLALLVERHRLEQTHRLEGVAPGEERARVGVAAVALLLREAGLLFLQGAGVFEHQAGERAGRPRAVDRAAVALRHESRQEARVVEMGVGEDDGVDLLRPERERAPVALLELVVALEETAVDEQAGVAELEQGAAAGDGAACADET